MDVVDKEGRMSKKKITKRTNPSVHICTGQEEGEDKPTEWNIQVVDEEPAPEFYCYYCGKVIVASNIREVMEGEDNGFLFEHDMALIHNDMDFLNVVVH